MPDIIELSNQFRASLLSEEREAALHMINAYGGVWNRLSREIAKLNKQIAAAREKGEEVGPSWLLRQKRYNDLLIQVEGELNRFSRMANRTITKQQQQAVGAARDDSVMLMEAAAEQANISATFKRLPAAAVEDMVGFLGDGSPLKSLLGQLPGDGRKIVEQGLIEAVALGQNPSQTARNIREGLAGNLKRALTISRTETLRAYRTATVQTYQKNCVLAVRRRAWGPLVAYPPLMS